MDGTFSSLEKESGTDEVDAAQIDSEVMFGTNLLQRAKKVVSDNPGLVDFAIRLVIFVLNLPDGQVLFFGEIQITEGL